MNKNSAVYKALLLGIVCTVCGLLLAVVNSITAPIIEKNAIAAVEGSLKEIFPDGSFKDVTEEYISQDESGLIDGIYEAEGKGYIFTLHNNGYGGEFTYMIGYDNDGKVAGYKGLENNETPGKGSLAFDEDYIEEVLGLTSSDPMPLITGSTITTQAVGEGVDAARAIFNSIMGIEYDPNAKPEEPEKEETSNVLGEGDYSKLKVECVDEGNGVYACKAKGFAGTNEAKITVEDGKIVAYEITSFKDDGDGVGDDLNSEEKLAKYIGATLDSEIDGETGATMTDNAFRAMAQAALNGGGASASEESEGGNTLGASDYSKLKAECTDEGDGVYACKAKGFAGTNEAKITIEDGKIVAYEITNFKDDGDGVGDDLNSEDKLVKYIGATLDSEIDEESGATKTDNAFKAMAQAALQAARE